MISEIGSKKKRIFPLSGLCRKTSAHRHPAGFTLIEIMITAAVLSLGTLLIHEAFFRSIDAFDYCSNYLNVVSWADEKIWQAQDEVTNFGAIKNSQGSGVLLNNNKNFAWTLLASPVAGATGLYVIDLSLSWHGGMSANRIKRTTFALYEKDKI